jgi:hypothetical protein
MKKIKGWWFSKEDKLPYGDNRKITVGITHEVKGPIIPCKNGLHLSKRIIDALEYAPGNIIWQVEGFGEKMPHGNPIDKYACRYRTYLHRLDGKDVLRKFARLCALDVAHLWDAPDIVIKYLKTGNEELRDAAWAAARAAAGTAAQKKQNKRLTQMVKRRLNDS